MRAEIHACATWVVTQFAHGENERLPAQRTGGLYKINCHQQGWSCRGLSVPFTENVLGEPCSPGRRGHASYQTESLPASTLP